MPKRIEMHLQTVALTADFAVSPPLSMVDFARVSAQGFKTAIDNRPDVEGGDVQPHSAGLERAAKAAGLHCAYLPVLSGAITAAQVQAILYSCILYLT